MEKHEFIGGGNLAKFVCSYPHCGLLYSDPIHVPAQPEQRWGETFPACIHCGHPGEHHDEEFGYCQESTDPECECPGYEAALQLASEPERVSDERLKEISAAFDGLSTSQKETGGIYWPEAISMARELRTLRTQLAEKDAAIEKARRDAHNEAVELVASFLEHKGQSEAAIIARMFTQGSITEADKAWADDRIRALAARKKEG